MLNRLLVQNTVDSIGECIAKYTYTIGKNGERTGILEEGLAGTTETEYTYDNAGRLTGEEIVTVESGSVETAVKKNGKIKVSIPGGDMDELLFD